MTDLSPTPFEPDDKDALDAQLRADIVAAIDDADRPFLVRAFRRLHPADGADLLEALSLEAFRQTVELLGDDLPPDVLIELRDTRREEAVDSLPDEALTMALEDLDSDDAALILDDIGDDRRERILTDLAPVDRAELERSLAYADETAGRLMQTEFVAVPEDWTVGDAIDYARGRGEDLPETFYDVYVIDPGHRLIGIVSLATLLRHPRDARLTSIMQDVLTDISPDTGQEDVAFQFHKYSLAAAPVTDAAGRMVGMITVDDMVDVLQEEHTSDLLALSNVTDTADSETVLGTVKARAPWLAVNLFTAFIASAIISLFGPALERLVALAILMPVVAALGGNAGSQGLAVTVRAIAERQLEGEAARRAIWREAAAGAINGFIFATGVAVVAYLWFRDSTLSLVLAAAMLATFIWAGLSGILVPLGLKKLGADPAVASSVFVLTLTDVMAFFSFLGLASLVLL